MGNHFHMATTYKNGSASLSNFMRYTHGLFGAQYNKTSDRSGSVAEGRPKTPLIQDDEHAMRVHFYIEANPIRAKFRKLSDLRYYIYSSYGFYAYGDKTRFTHLLTIPEWYLKLGRTPKERQSTYRKLFAKYLGENATEYSAYFKQRFIGTELWIFEVTTFAKRLLNSNKQLLVKIQNSGQDTG
jgi:putative transposase